MPLFATSFDGTQIAFDVAGGDAPPIVLVHGWSCDRGYWDAQREVLAEEFKVVTIDLAGHGESRADRKDWSITAFGRDVAAVMDLLKLDDAILVGHSMGGDVILEAAKRAVSHVRALVWVDTYDALPHERSGEEVQRFMAPFRGDFRQATQEFVRRMFHAAADATLVERIALDMSSAPQAIALCAMESALSFGAAVPALIAELALPVVAINPERLAANAKSLTSFGIDVVLIPGVGHFPMMENPLAFNRALLLVARRLQAGGGPRRDA